MLRPIALTLLLALSWADYASAQVKLVPQLAHGGGGARISRDGRYSVRWLGATELTLWDHHSGLFLGSIEPPDNVANRCAIAPGGRHLAYLSGKHVAIQDLDTGRVWRVGPHPNGVTGVFFSLDGQRLYVAHAKENQNGKTSEQALTLWSFPQTKRSWSMKTPVEGGGFLDHSSFAASGSSDRLFRLAGKAVEVIASGKVTETISLPPSLPHLSAFALSADEKRAASVTWRQGRRRFERIIELSYWDWSRKKVTKSVQVGKPRDMAFLASRDILALSPDGRRVLVLGLAREGSDQAYVAGYAFGAEKPTYVLDELGDVLAFSRDSERAIVGHSVRFANTGKLALPAVPEKSEWDFASAVHGDLAFVAQGRDFAMWDLKQLKLSWQGSSALPDSARSVEVSEDGRRVLIGTKKHYMLFDVQKRTLAPLRPEGESIAVMSFHGPDEVMGFSLQVSDYDSQGRPRQMAPRRWHYSIQQGKTLEAPRTFAKRPRAPRVAYSRDGRWLAQLELDSQLVELRHLDSGKVAQRWKLKKKATLPRLLWTKHSLVVVSDNIVELFDPAQKQPLATHTLGSAAAVFLHLALSPDGKTLAVSGAGSLLRRYDAATGKKLGEHSTASIGYGGQVSIGERWAVVAAGATPSALRLSNGRSARLLNQRADWVIAAPDGTFTASKNGGRLLAATQGRRGFFVDQLALVLNDPAKLLAELDTGTTAQREFFAAQRRRRLRRAKLSAETSTSDLFENAPEARFLTTRVDGKHVDIELEASASRGLLSYNIDINGVPVFGRSGRALSGDKQRLKQRVELSAGDNRVELRVVDRAGIESLRPFRVFSYKQPVTRRLFFVGFGVSSYANPKFDLAYAHKDVLDLAAALEHAKGHFSEVKTLALVNERVTPEAIVGARSFLKQARVDDMVILMVAGHGVHSRDAEARYYFVTHGTKLDQLAQTASPFEDIEALLHGIAPRNKLLLMDTCESGERDPEDESSAVAAAGSRGLKARTTRALVLEAESAAKPQVRRFVLERDRFILQDVLRRSGAVVLSSSQGTELSYETDEVHNGVFTEAVLRALTGSDADRDNNGWVDHRELRSSVLKTVTRLTQNAQHPTVDRDNRAIDFALPLIPQAASIADRTTAPLPEAPATASASPQAAAPPPTAPGARGCGCRLPESSSEASHLGWVAALLLLGRRRRS